MRLEEKVKRGWNKANVIFFILCVFVTVICVTSFWEGAFLFKACSNVWILVECGAPCWNVDGCSKTASSSRVAKLQENGEYIPVILCV